MKLLHIAATDDLVQAQMTGNYVGSTRGRTLAEEGFVHLSTTSQLSGVLQRFYTDADPEQFRLLVIDIDVCVQAGSPLRWDAVGDQLFGHVYGPIPVVAVMAQLPLNTDLANCSILENVQEKPPTTA